MARTKTENKKETKVIDTTKLVKKREGYLSWNEYFMALAKLSSMR